MLAPLREALTLLADDYAAPVPAGVLSTLRRTRLSLVERVERPLRLGQPGVLADYGRMLAPFARRLRVRGGVAPVRPLAALAIAHRLLVRLPWKHGVRRVLGRRRAHRASP